MIAKSPPTIDRADGLQDGGTLLSTTAEPCPDPKPKKRRAITMTAEYLRVCDIAETLHIDPMKILGWIRSGELRAIDISERKGGRPRWRIPRESWDAFCAARSNQATLPPPRATRRRRRFEDHQVLLTRKVWPVAIGSGQRQAKW
jgi:hypothetical protein